MGVCVIVLERERERVERERGERERREREERERERRERGICQFHHRNNNYVLP